MSRRNYIHTMDALIYGYSNFTFTEPTTTSRVRSEVANAPMSFDETDYRTSRVFITPSLETVKPDVIPTPTYVNQNATNEVTSIYQDDVRRLAPIRPPAPAPFVPIIDVIPTPTYVNQNATNEVTSIYQDDVRRLAPIRPPAPTPAPIPVITSEDDVRIPAPFIPIIDIINPTPTYVKPDETSKVVRTYEDDTRRSEPTPSPFTPVSISEKDQDRNVTPIVTIINPSPYVAPALNTDVGGALGGGTLGGGSMGGGGGDMAKPRKPLSGSVVTKPSFIKKHFIPILLIASAIYVFIKKPIK